MDRLSVAALFDRNRSLLSCLFDVVLAALISILAGLLLSRAIFYDVSVIVFSVVVAGTHVIFFLCLVFDKCAIFWIFSNIFIFYLYKSPLFISFCSWTLTGKEKIAIRAVFIAFQFNHQLSPLHCSWAYMNFFIFTFFSYRILLKFRW